MELEMQKQLIMQQQQMLLAQQLAGSPKQPATNQTKQHDSHKKRSHAHRNETRKTRETQDTSMGTSVLIEDISADPPIKLEETKIEKYDEPAIVHKMSRGSPQRQYASPNKKTTPKSGVGATFEEVEDDDNERKILPVTETPEAKTLPSAMVVLELM